MSDTMPERVWVGSYSPTLPNPMTAPCWLSDPALAGDDDPFTPYVPEQRALDAERERDALLAGGERAVLDYMSRKSDRLKEENAALRAERDALRADLAVLAGYAEPWLDHMTEELAHEGQAPSPHMLAARAILDRERT